MQKSWWALVSETEYTVEYTTWSEIRIKVTARGLRRKCFNNFQSAEKWGEEKFQYLNNGPIYKRYEASRKKSTNTPLHS